MNYQELLYRARLWQADTWTEGFVFKIWDEWYLCWGMKNDEIVKERIDPETLSRCSGIQDCHQNYLWTGDLVESVSWNEFFSKNGSPMEALKRKMEVVFRHGRFCLEEILPDNTRGSLWEIGLSGYDLQIIGNTRGE